MGKKTENEGEEEESCAAKKGKENKLSDGETRERERDQKGCKEETKLRQGTKET